MTTPSTEVQELLWDARAGDRVAQNNLGTMYQMGVGVAKDEMTAFEWYHRAADQGYAAAQFNLGWMYREGRGVAKDERTACEWYLQAAQQGHVAAQFNLGVIYGVGRGVVKDERTAYLWFRCAAEQGFARAQVNLGNAYAYGKGVAKDDGLACEWYHRAAEQGHALAQIAIGWRYLNGRGFTQNDKHAFVWIQRSAEQKDPLAEYWLGWMYENGRGVIKDEIKAMELYARAANNISVIRGYAEQGYFLAQEALKALTTKEVQEERKAIVEDSYIQEQLEKMAEFEANCKQAIQDSRKILQEHRSELTRIRSALDSTQQFDPLFHTLKARENELISVLDREEEHQCALREKSKISKNDSLYSFYYMFRRLFNDVMNACKLINSGMLEDLKITPIGKTTKIIDRISKIVRKVAGNVPIINIFVEVFTTALDTASEIMKETAVQSASTYLPDAVEIANIAELLARYLTLAEEHTILRKSNIPPTGRVKKIINAITVNDIDTEVKKYAEALFKIFLSKVFTNKIKKCPEASDIPELIFAITNRHFNLTINLLNNHVSQNSLLTHSQGPVFDREAKLLQEIERLKTLVVQTEAKHRAEMESQRWEDIKRREEEEARRRQEVTHLEKRFATLEQEMEDKFRGFEEAFARQGNKEQGSKEQGREPSKSLIFNRMPEYDQAVAEMGTTNRFRGQDIPIQHHSSGRGAPAAAPAARIPTPLLHPN